MWENESDLYLEIAKFLDPSLYLKNDQCEISDPLIYNKPMFAFERNSLWPEGVPKGGPAKNPPLWILKWEIQVAQKLKIF